MESLNFQPIALDHCSRYPGLQVEDLYKLVHQAALGSEHAVKDIEGARRWLMRELGQLPLTSTEPIIDVITPNQSIARVHLKPYIDSAGEPENLLLAFIQTADKFIGSTNLLKAYWKDIQVLAQMGDIPFSLDLLRSYFERMETANFPAVHHSQQYELTYQPSYRVIALDFLAYRIGDNSTLP